VETSRFYSKHMSGEPAEAPSQIEGSGAPGCSTSDGVEPSRKRKSCACRELEEEPAEDPKAAMVDAARSWIGTWMLKSSPGAHSGGMKSNEPPPDPHLSTVLAHAAYTTAMLPDFTLSAKEFLDMVKETLQCTTKYIRYPSPTDVFPGVDLARVPGSPTASVKLLTTLVGVILFPPQARCETNPTYGFMYRSGGVWDAGKALLSVMTEIFVSLPFPRLSCCAHDAQLTLVAER
jgi:hypothetical protein